MQKFIIGGLVGMLIALGCVVLVWWYLQRSLFAPAPDMPLPDSMASTTPSATTAATQELATTSTTTPAAAPGVPVRDLPLTAEQRQAAESLGFDTEQMVLSPALIACARETLGESRYQAILAGDTPTFLETARLLPCVGR